MWAIFLYNIKIIDIPPYGREGNRTPETGHKLGKLGLSILKNFVESRMSVKFVLPKETLMKMPFGKRIEYTINGKKENAPNQ